MMDEIKGELIERTIKAFDDSQDLTDELSLVLHAVCAGVPVPEHAMRSAKEAIRDIRKTLGFISTLYVPSKTE